MSEHPRCKHLCFKSLLVYGEGFANDPEYQEGMTEFWCILTGRGQGPDDEHVSMAACTDPERSCYQEY